jgi:hypothetical protein
VRDSLVESDFTGEPPDPIRSAHAGEVQPIPLLENGEVAHGDRTIAEFYGAVYGDYRIGMNCSQGKTFTYAPEGFTSGLDLVSGKVLTAPIAVAPQTTVVLVMGSAAGVKGVIQKPGFRNPRAGIFSRLLGYSLQGRKLE